MLSIAAAGVRQFADCRAVAVAIAVVMVVVVAVAVGEWSGFGL